MQRKSGGVVGLLGLMMEIYISWCHSHIIMTLQLKLNKEQFIEARTVFSSHICVVGMKRVNLPETPYTTFLHCNFNQKYMEKLGKDYNDIRKANVKLQ